MKARPNAEPGTSRPAGSVATTALLAVPAAGHLLGYLFPTWRHVADRSWPLHARFHALQSLLLTMGWDTTVLIVALDSRRRPDGWERPALAVYFAFVQAGYFAALAGLPAGRPKGLRYHLAFAVSAALFGWGVIRRGRERRQEARIEPAVRPGTQGRP